MSPRCGHSLPRYGASARTLAGLRRVELAVMLADRSSESAALFLLQRSV